MVSEYKKDDGITRGGSGSDLVVLYPALKVAFPDAAFVKITRPYADVLRSYRRSFPNEADVETLLEAANESFEAIDEFTCPYDELDERMGELEDLVGVHPNGYKRELMMNTVATIKALRY